MKRPPPNLPWTPSYRFVVKWVRDETVSLRATEMQIPTLEAEDERPLVITLPSVALERQRMMQLGRCSLIILVTAKYILRCWMRR